MTILAPDSPPDVPAHAPVVLQVARLRRHPPRGAPVDGLDLDVRTGEIVALLGDAGCGTSTLIRVLAGCEPPDAGEIRVAAPDAGERLEPIPTGSRRAAIRAGIGLVERRSLAPGLTGLDNIVLGSESWWRPWHRRRATRATLGELQQRLDLTVDLDLPVAALSHGDRLQVALLRTLHRRPRVILLDEPAAGSSAQQTAHLFAILRKLAARGVAAVLATRQPETAIGCAGRIVIVRAGRKATDVAARGYDGRSLAALMIGRRLEELAVEPAVPGVPVLELANVDAPATGERIGLRGVSLDVREREIVAVAGGAGNGQATLMALFSGLTTPRAGRLRLYGRTPRRLDPALLVRVGVGRVPGDCRADGIIPGMSVLENFLLEDIHSAELDRRGLLARRRLREIGRRLLAEAGIESARADQSAERLGDADMRRLVLTRVLDRAPGLIIADHPTRDLDLDGRRAVHRRLVEERDRGAGILLISDDADEVIAISDYVGVLHEGRLTIPQPVGALDRETLGLMLGGQGSLAQDWSGWGGGT